MAQFYHRDQASAPTLTYSSAQSSAHHFDAFKAVLKACLVTGYGALPAAGWELIYESALSLVLRNGTHSGYVCFQRESSLTTVTVWLAATYSGVDANGKIIGGGVRSGVAANSGAPQRITVRDFASYEASTSWSMVADQGTFIICLSGHLTSFPATLLDNVGQVASANGALYCGDDAAGDFVCIGGKNTPNTNAGLNYYGFGASGFSALKFPDTGLLVGTAAITVSMPGTLTGNTAALFEGYPSGVVLPEVNLAPLTWICNSAVRRLRGLAVDSRLLFLFSSVLSQAIGGPALTTRSVGTELSLGDGYGYMVARAYSNQGIGMLMTNNPGFWS